MKMPGHWNPVQVKWVSITIVLLSLQLDSNAQPHIEFDPPNLHLTAEWWGDWDGNNLMLSIESFWICNQGDEALRIDSITVVEEEFEMEWRFAPHRFNLDPFSSREIEMVVTASWWAEGRQDITFQVFSNDPDNESIDYNVEMIFFQGGDWGPWAQNVSREFYLTEVLMNEDPVEGRWRLDILTPDGALIGQTGWNGHAHLMTMWLDDPETEEIEGLGENEQPQFDLIDLETGEVFEPETDYSWPDEWGESNLIWLSVYAENLQESRIPIARGWSLISINVLPNHVYWNENQRLGLIQMWEQLRYDGGHHLLLSKDQDGRFYRPTADEFCNIPYWNVDQGYLVNVDADVTFSLIGRPIHAQSDISLRQGWNIAPYYPDYDLPATVNSGYYVISPIRDYVIVAKDDDGNFMIPERGFSNMPPWREGQAYQIKVSEAVTLNYPAVQQMRSAEIGIEDENPTPDVLNQHFHPVTRTGSNMSVLLILEPEHTDVPSAEIGAFTSSGLCVGATSFQIPNSKFQIGLAVWGDDPSTEVIEGAVEGEGLTFRLWNGQTEEVLHFGEDRHSCLSYQTDEFASGVISRTGMSDLPDQITLFPPSPNPFNSTTRISFALPSLTHTKVTLFDNAGRSIRVIAENVFSAGTHFLSLDAGNLPAGIYFVQLEANGTAMLQKAIITK